jgi:hypothetical protein
MYEIIFKYYKHKDNLDYDRTESLILKKKFGQIEEEYPLDKIACYIMSQLARRDIFIHDVEIYSYVKKNVSFKISKNGFSINGQKFGHNDTVTEFNLIESTPEKPPQPACEAITQKDYIPKPDFAQLQKKVESNKERRIIKNVIFIPPLQMDKTRFPYKFTINKKYPVYAEKLSPSGIGMTISTNDDNGNPIDVSDEYFIPANNSLEFDNDMNASKRGNNDLLNWQGDRSSGSMPKLR